jgi:signal transduction histidine kinase
MNLVPKLTLTFIAGVSLILAVNGFLRVRREVALFETDRIRDDVQIGETLAAAVTAVWQLDGEERAISVVRQTDAHEGRVRVRWVWLDGDLPERLAARRDDLATLARGGWRSFVADDHGERRYTIVPVETAPGRHGALEVSEPMATERAYIRRTVADTIVTTLTLDGVCAALAMLVGSWIVGRPMALLMDKAQHVGRGDFGPPLRLRQRDEIFRLANEMNAMCDRLVAANDRAAAEMRARLEMLEQLRHADRLMTVGKLASGIAHELGTPLNVIEARATMIAGGETTPDESVTCAKAVLRSTDRMTRIIRQLLAFARTAKPEKSRCDVVGVARRTVELLEPLARKRQVALRVDASATVFADVDARQVEQAITNLTMNAAQATERAGTVDLVIDRARARPPADHGGEEGEYVRIRVRDHGHGIAPEHLPRLFEPFFTTKDVGEGTGLGLAVSYGIVREHGGWIGVESEVGRGTTFTIHLPAGEASTISMG